MKQDGRAPPGTIRKLASIHDTDGTRARWAYVFSVLFDEGHCHARVVLHERSRFSRTAIGIRIIYITAEENGFCVIYFTRGNHATIFS